MRRAEVRKVTMVMQRAALLIVSAIAGLINGIMSHKIEVLVNESAFIDCSLSRPEHIQWHHTAPGKYSNAYMYAGGRFYIPYNTSRFRLTNNGYTLVIYNVTGEDAGLYECKDDIASGVFDSTHLTVLDSSPVCASNMMHNSFVGPNTCNLEEETMTFTCAVSFSGNPPNLMWRSSNANQTLNGSVCETKDNRINCSLSMKANVSFDGSTLICQTTTTPDDAPYNCSIEDITVEYFIADIDTVEKTVNDNVSCIVTSNLPIHYNWTLQQNEQIAFLGANRTILIEKPGLHQCVVEYNIRNGTCYHWGAAVNASNYVNIKEVTDKHSNALTIPLQIVIAIFVAAVIAAAVIAVVIIYFKRKGMKFPPMDLQPRIEYIKSRLTKICTILQFDALLKQLVKFKAISKENLKAFEKDVEENRIARLASVIAYGHNFSLLTKAVKSKNETLGKYLTEGEIIAVDVSTSRPDLDDRLSKALNDLTAQQPKLFSKLSDSNISVAASKPENSIEVFIYCFEMEDMKTFIELFNGKRIDERLNEVLNDLLAKIEPANAEGLKTTTSISQYEVSAIENFTGQQDCIFVYTEIGKIDGFKSYFSVYNLDKFKSDEGLPEYGNEDETLPSESDRLLANQPRPELSLTPDEPVITNASEQEDKKNDLDEYFSVSAQPTSIPPNKSKHRPIQNQRAVGMTFMMNELFVIYESCSVIESYCCDSYDCTDCKYKQIENMNNPKDIASCRSRQCLYILNTNADKSTVEILQMDPKTSVIKAKWKLEGSHGRISVSKGAIVVSLLRDKVRHVIKYNPDDLSSIYRFSFNDSAFESPLRVLKGNSDRFLCLEESAKQSTEVNLFLVDSKGVVLKKTQLSDANSIFAQHFHLITDTKGNAIVADRFGNQTVCMYDSNLENGKELISTPYINTPDLIALDESDERLFVLCQVNDSVYIQVVPITRQKS